MAELKLQQPLKNLYSKQLIHSLAQSIQTFHAEFNIEKFERDVFSPEWDDMPLKRRMYQIPICIQKSLNLPFNKAAPLLSEVASHFNGFEYMFFPAFIELYGLDDVNTSLDALEKMTLFSSSEFAIRPFILKHPEQTLPKLNSWSHHSNEHVRRLASEGCRPRLPWAMALPDFKQDPAPILPILENLNQDTSKYVQKSVANNLNDIAKDHPEIVLALCRKWQNRTSQTNWIIKHGCRTLLKNGNPKALSLFGYPDPSHIKITHLQYQPKVKMGKTLDFSFMLTSTHSCIGKLRIEYEITFVRQKQKTSTKVFKISESDYESVSKTVNKSHSFKPISTRKYYPGTHSIRLILNGIKQTAYTFELVENKD